MIHLSSESHLSIHTFVDEEKVAMELFTCSLSVENEKKRDHTRIFFVGAAPRGRAVWTQRRHWISCRSRP